MDDEEKLIEEMRQLLYSKIDSNVELTSSEILILSKELDAVIASSYKNQLKNIDND